MPLAYLKTGAPDLTDSVIDADKGIIRGVKIMELGKLACFVSSDGKVRNVKIDQRHINALLAHAGKGAKTSHLTHDWMASRKAPNADTVEMNARIAAAMNHRKAENGDLIGDYFIKEGDIRRDICWQAEHTPQDIMLSAVFNFAKDDPDCIPVDYQAVDLVSNGAATTALFADATDKTDMDILELLKQAAADPTKRAALKALIREIEKGDNTDGADAAVDSAAMKAAIDKAIADHETAVLAKIAEQNKENETALLKRAEAALVKNIGSNPAFRNIGGGQQTNVTSAFNEAVTAALSAGAKNRGEAIAFVARNKPEVYAAHMKAIGG